MRCDAHLVLTSTVYAGAAGEHERLDVVEASKLQETSRSLYIRVHVNKRVLDGGAHTRTRSHVHYPLDTLRLENAPDKERITKVALEEDDAVRTILLKEHGDVGAFRVYVVVVIDLMRFH